MIASSTPNGVPAGNRLDEYQATTRHPIQLRPGSCAVRVHFVGARRFSSSNPLIMTVIESASCRTFTMKRLPGNTS